MGHLNQGNFGVVERKRTKQAIPCHPYMVETETTRKGNTMIYRSTHCICRDSQ